MLLPERLAGAVYGHLVGDALGVPYEFTPADRIGAVEWRGHGTHDQPPGTWSDDGALMLALLDSLLSVGFDTADQAKRALAWRDHGAYAPGGLVFDIGSATSTALTRLRQGVAPEKAGGVEALGNGSLMRILPVALVMRAAEDEELVELASRASRVTHGSAEAQIACALYALVARRLLGGEDDPTAVLAESRRDLRAVLEDRGLPGSREAPEPAQAIAAMDAFEAWPERGGRGRVVDSFWAAWDAFAGASDYPAAVMAAVAYGNDTDTTAAIAGGLAGVHWGIDGIPIVWQRGLRDRAIAQELADRLIETDDSEWDGTPWRTSRMSPLRVDPLDLAGTDLQDADGSVGLTFLPGKRYLGYYSGPHWRDLDTDAVELAGLGVDVLLLLVEDQELERCRVTDIAEVVPLYGVDLVRLPLVDLKAPADEAGLRAALASVLARTRAGEMVAIACRGGLDRTGMVAALLLTEAGLEPEEAITRVHAARRHTLSVPEQVRFVRHWRVN